MPRTVTPTRPRPSIASDADQPGASLVLPSVTVASSTTGTVHPCQGFGVSRRERRSGRLGRRSVRRRACASTNQLTQSALNPESP
jgi:hypothetical protein